MESLCLLFLLSSPLAFTKWSLVQVGKKDGQEDKGSQSPSSPSSTKLTKFKLSPVQVGNKYGEEDKRLGPEPGSEERDQDYQDFSDDQDDKNDQKQIRTRAMVASHLKRSSSK